MVSKRNVSKIKKPLTNALSSSPKGKGRLSQVAVPIVLVIFVLMFLILLSACCPKPSTTIDFQKPSIPPALLLPRRQLTAFSGATCDDLAGYAFYAIEEYNNCSADFNALGEMVK